MTNSGWPGQTRAAITLSFDDGFFAACQSTAGVLHDRGLRGTYNVLTGHVGAAFEGLPVASWTDWRQVHDWGHEIASHGVSHRPLAGPFSDAGRLLQSAWAASDRLRWLRMTVNRLRALSAWQPDRVEMDQVPADPLTEVAISREQLQQQIPGLTVNSFAYPSGRYNKSAQLAVAAAGYRSARSHTYGLNNRNSNPFALRAVGLGAGLAPDDIEPLLERATVTGGWLILVFHLVSERNTDNYPYWLSTSEFQLLLDRLQRLTFWIATQAEVTRFLWSEGKAGGVT